ncbi:MAG: cytochrome c3 family protein [Myxococcota bacterium]
MAHATSPRWPVELCRSCHNDKLKGFLSQRRGHAPVLSADGCLHCHSPHASKDVGLLRSNGVAVCGECHADTLARQRTAATKHEPVEKGECNKCHLPHGGDAPLYLRGGDTIELCGICHDWQKHSTHPIGPKRIDPRNKNLTMQCLSCHRAHGTEYKHMIPLPTATALCTQCHQDFKR